MGIKAGTGTTRIRARVGGRIVLAAAVTAGLTITTVGVTAAGAQAANTGHTGQAGGADSFSAMGAAAGSRKGSGANPWSGYQIKKTGQADGAWLGGYQLPNGVKVYRIDPIAKALPTGYGAATSVSNLGGPKKPTARQTARAAYVLSVYGTYKLAVQSAAVDAVTYDLVSGPRWHIGTHKPAHRAQRGVQRINQARYSGYIHSYAKKLLKASATYAGPYRTGLVATPTTAGSNTDGTMVVRSASEHGMVGLRVVFHYGHAAPVTAYTDKDGKATVTFPATQAGTSQMTATVHGLPTSRLLVKKPSHTRASRVVVAGRRGSVVAAARVAVAGTQTVTVANTRSVYTTDQNVGGTWTVTGAGGARNATVSLYGPFTYASSATCTSPVVSSTTRVVDADAAYPLPAQMLADVGFYRWGVSVDGNDTNQPASVCGGAFSVKAIPTVTITRNQSPTQAGRATAATTMITGLQTSTPLTVTSRLYGPFKSTAAATCATSRLYKAVQDTVHGNGSQATGPVKPNAAGWYVWQITLAGGDYSTSTTSTCGASGTYLQVIDAT